MSPSTRKSHQTAVAALPAPRDWEAIQEIRIRHDRQFRRWMPHVNLLYPFVPEEEIDASLADLTAAVATIAPFEATLATFRSFVHRSGRATIYLAPEPAGPLVTLQAALGAAFPAHHDVARFAGGFTPHLSVGQTRTAEAARALCEELQAAWEPIGLAVRKLAVIARAVDGPFGIVSWVPLGGGD